MDSGEQGCKNHRYHQRGISPFRIFAAMEDWQLDFEWLKVRHLVKDQMGKDTLPDLQSILFLIGIQELGFLKDDFTKEEKQDLMHIAVCELLISDGYYTFVGRDEDGWPHYEPMANVEVEGVKQQEKLIKEKVIKYFQTWEKEAHSPSVES